MNIVISILIAFLAVIPLWAENFFNGKVVDEYGKGIKNVAVNVHGVEARTNDNGIFKIKVDHLGGAQSFMASFKHENYYSDIQAFSISDMKAKTMAALSLVEKVPGRMLFNFTGDAMMGRRFYDKNYLTHGKESSEIPEQLKHLKEIFHEMGDISSTNLETGILANVPAEGVDKSYTFYSDPVFPQYLFNEVGINLFGLANNHVLDFGWDGFLETLHNLKASHIPFTGAGHDKECSFIPYRARIGNQKVDFFNFIANRAADSGFKLTSEDNLGGPPFSGVGNLKRYIGKAVEKNESVIITQLHASKEYTSEPSKGFLRSIDDAISAGSHLIIGHGPHVIQGFAFRSGVFVAYSLGNFIFDQIFPETMKSMILRVWMDGKKFHRAQIVPIVIKNFIPKLSVLSYQKNVLQTLKHLSHKNGVSLNPTGGQAYIVANGAEHGESQSSDSVKFSSALSGDIVSLKRMPWYRTPKMVTYKEACSFSIGHDELIIGNFDTDNVYDPDQKYFWNYDEKSEIREDDTQIGSNIFSLSSVGSLQVARPFRISQSSSWTLRFFEKHKTSGELVVSIVEHSDNGKVLRTTEKKVILEPKVNTIWREITIPPLETLPNTRKISLSIKSNASNGSVLLKDINFIAWDLEEIACNADFSTTRADFLKFTQPVKKSDLEVLY